MESEETDRPMERQETGRGRKQEQHQLWGGAKIEPVKKKEWSEK